MPEGLPTTAAKIAIRVAAAAMGAAAAGPLGCAIGAAFGDALSGPLGELAHKLADEGGKKAIEKLFDASGDAAAEKIKGESGNLDRAYREALRLGLVAVRARVGSEYPDWFEDWERCLKSRDVLRLDEVRPEALSADEMNAVLRRTMVRLDAQGAMLRAGSISIWLVERVMPEELDATLERWLPGAFDESFKALIVSKEYKRAWKQTELGFRRFLADMVAAIKADTTAIKTDTTVLVSGQKLTNEKLDLANETLNQLRALALQRAEEDKRIDRAEARAQQAEGEAEKWKRMYLELAKADPSLEKLLEIGDLDAAARTKEDQLRKQKSEQARTYSELGKINELRFDWAKALEAYREAWLATQNFEYGSQYALFAAKQHHYAEATTAYEALRLLPIERASISVALNNLGLLYQNTQRIQEAEDSLQKALSIRRDLAKENADAYLPDLAMTLNNLGGLYRATQRMPEAEQVCEEGLAIYRKLAEQNVQKYLPWVAASLNNLAIIYSDTQRQGMAETAYVEALSIYRWMAMLDAKVYMPDVALALNNLAILYGDTQRLSEAEKAYNETLSIYRDLVEVNPEAYLEALARTLDNFGQFYSDAQKFAKAETHYTEALSIRRRLGEENPEVYMPDVAQTLYNLSNLYRGTQREEKAFEACREAEAILRPLWRVNRKLYGNLLAKILWGLAYMHGQDEAVEACRLAREGLEVAYDEDIRAGLRALIAEWCGNSG